MIPLHETPIYAQLKAERALREVMEWIKSQWEVARAAVVIVWQGIRDAFTSLLDTLRSAGITPKPKRKQLIHNGKKPR